MANKRKEISKEELIDLYSVKRYSQRKIGEILKCCQSTIGLYLEEYGIPHRTHSKEDLTGKIFGEYKVISKVIDRSRGYNDTKWKCECSCGNIRNLTRKNLINGECKSCGKCGVHYFIKAEWWSAIKTNAKAREFVVEIDQEYIYQIFLKQNGKCAFTGIELIVPEETKEQYGPKCTASLDRIDSNLGYIKGNVQWVHKDINRMKWDLSDEKFIQICKLVGEYRK